MKMTVQQSINRGLNLLGTAIVGLAGFAFAPEIFLENEWADRADDIGLFLLGIAAICWYLWKDNRYARSLAPVFFVVVALALKIAALMIEFDDPDAAGDDFGGVILFVLSAILVGFLFWRTKKLLEENSSKR